MHEEERLLENEFEVNAEVQFHENAKTIDSLSETINYTEVYDIIKKQMHIPARLLETVVMNIGNSIHNKYEYVRSIYISLKKMHPPIEGIQGAVGVSWHKEF